VIADLIRALNRRKDIVFLKRWLATTVFTIGHGIADLKGALKRRKDIVSLRRWFATRVFTIGDEENGLPVLTILVVSIIILVIASLLPLGCRGPITPPNHTEKASSP
jgi:hypothetical protein